MNFTMYTTTKETPWKHVESMEKALCNTTLSFTGETDQVFEGFGGCFNELSQIAIETLPKEAQEEIYDALFSKDADGVRFDFCRLPIGASDYAERWYSHNETEGDYKMEHFSIERDEKYLIPYIQAAKKRNPELKLFASPWSPPTWMKTHKACNFGTLIQTDENLSAYALYFLKFVKAYEEKGLPIAQVHVQNEPMADQKFPSCKWTGEDMRDFIKGYLGPAFEASGLDTEIWLGTINGPFMDILMGPNTPFSEFYDQWANTVLSDKEARKYITGVGLQWGGKHILDHITMSYPEMRIMQTESECGDSLNSWQQMEYIYGLMWQYFVHGAERYTYWNIALPNDSVSTWGWKQNSLVTVDKENGTYRYNPEFYVMKHFSQFVQPGAKRIVTKGHWTSNALVFENPDQSLVVIVGSNMNNAREFTFSCGEKSFSAQIEPHSLHTFVIA